MSSPLHGKTITSDMRDEWLVERATRIGASEISAAIGINSYDSVLRLWLTKTKKLPKKEATPEMEVGSALESAILGLYARRYKKTIVREQVFHVSQEYDFLCATLDGITEDGLNVQVKNVGCASAYRWGAEWTDEIPHEVITQVQMEMFCADLDMTHVAALIGGSDLRVYPIQRDPKIIKVMIQKGAEFMESVRMNKYPEPDAKNDHELIKYLFPGCEGMITFDQDQTELALTWEKTGDELKLLESAHKKLKLALGMEMGEASQATLTDGRTLYRSITRVPESLRPVKAYSFPVFRIKETK